MRGGGKCAGAGGEVGGRFVWTRFLQPAAAGEKDLRIAGFGAVAEIDADLMEWNYGEFEGKFSEEVHRERPGWELFRDGAPGGIGGGRGKARGSVYRKGEADRRGCGGFYERAYRAGHRARWIGLGVEGAGKLLFSTARVGILSYEHDVEHPAIGVWNGDGAVGHKIHAGRHLGVRGFCFSHNLGIPGITRLVGMANLVVDDVGR